MSAENVELIREGHERFSAGGPDAILEILDPDIEIIPMEESPGGRSYRGHDGFRQYLADVGDVFVRFGWEATELIDLGDRVVAQTRFFGQGRGSGVPVELIQFIVWTVRGGKAVSAHGYLQRDAALAAAATT